MSIENGQQSKTVNSRNSATPGGTINNRPIIDTMRPMTLPHSTPHDHTGSGPTAVALAAIVGSTALLTDLGRPMGYLVRITDARWSFGRVHVCVRPIKGEGSAWVVRDQLTDITKS